MKTKLRILILLSVGFFISCTEEDKTYGPTGRFTTKDSFTVEQGVASSEMAISNIVHIIQLALDEESILNSNSSIYPIITKEKLDPFQASEYPLKLTIDFGLDTLVCFDHRVRKGKIIANVSSHWKDSLSTIEAQIIDYYMSTNIKVDPVSSDLIFKTDCNSNLNLIIKYEGITNRYDNTYYPTQSIIIDSAEIETPLGNVIISTRRFIFYKEGFNTDTYDDDKTLNILFSEGEANDKKNMRWTFSALNSESINEGLPYFAFNRACNWLISGDIKLVITPENSDNDRTTIINFGNSNQTACDNTSSYSYNGLSIVISLP
jgi:hypothetical protein